MLSKLKQVAGFLNLPVMVLVMLAVLIVCGMSFLVKKLASRSSKKHSKSIVIVSKDKEESLKLPNRKKRSKKQRSVEIGSQQVLSNFLLLMYLCTYLKKIIYNNQKRSYLSILKSSNIDIKEF